jgi:hypothetical protein
MQACYDQETSGLVKVFEEDFPRGDQISPENWLQFVANKQ